MQLSYLGPAGTFSHEAANNYLHSQLGGGEAKAYPSFQKAADAVLSGAVDAAILPIENSFEGSVTFTTDILIGATDLRLCAELILPVRNNLIAKAPLALEKVRRVLSHPQPLGQCREWLARHIPPEADYIETASTARAVEMLTSPEYSDGAGGTVAIGTRAAADLYKMWILAEDIQDSADNTTRFVIAARRDAPRTGRDKTSLVMIVLHHPGALVRALTVFDALEIQMTKIESRPSKRLLGEYVFLVDIEGHREDDDIKVALAVLAKKTGYLRLLGSYPRV